MRKTKKELENSTPIYGAEMRDDTLVPLSELKEEDEEEGNQEEQELESSEVKVEDIGAYSKKVSNSLVSIRLEDLRPLVDTYYQDQKGRITINNQIIAIEKGLDSDNDEEQKCEALRWVLASKMNEELQIKKMLEGASNNFPIGRWVKQVVGIGPVIASCLIAFLDVDKASSVTHFWSYAGLNDNVAPWLGNSKAREIVTEAIAQAGGLNDDAMSIIAKQSGRKFEAILKLSISKDSGKINKETLIKNLAKPPYNTKLKTLCWKIGESFCKQNVEKSFYARQYRARLAYETEMNEKGAYKQEAMIQLGFIPKGRKDHNMSVEETNAMFDDMLSKIQAKEFVPRIDKKKITYNYLIEGKLSKGHIMARSKRWVTKLFLSHLFEAMYIERYKAFPPAPYIIQYGGHVDYIASEVPYTTLWDKATPEAILEHVKKYSNSGVPDHDSKENNRLSDPDTAQTSMDWVKRECERLRRLMEDNPTLTFDAIAHIAGYNPSQKSMLEWALSEDIA